MNRCFAVVIIILSLSFLLGCAPQQAPQAPAPESTPPAATAEAIPAAPAPASDVQEELSMHYMEAATALGVDNFEVAKAALTELAKKSTGELQTLAQAAAATGQIAALREAFKPLSEVATKMKLPEGYAVAFCPMYKGGAKWVQKRETLSNPYFGQSMATCGNFIN